MTATRPCAALAAASLSIALACAAAPPPDESQRPPLSEIDGETWLLVRMRDRAELLAHAPVTLVFSGGQIRGGSGCNRYSGGFESAEPGRVRFGSVASTRMMCVPDRMELEGSYLAALAKVADYRIAGDELWLGSELDEPLAALVFRRADRAAQ